MESGFHTQMLSLIREVFGYNIEIADESFAYKLVQHKERMKRCEQSRNAEWKARFLNRLAPMKINCCLKYEKPVKKGRGV